MTIAQEFALAEETSRRSDAELLEVLAVEVQLRASKSIIPRHMMSSSLRIFANAWRTK